MAIIPAHNEEDGIEKTIRSLLRQVPAPSVVLVMADNCTDETIPRARAAGAEVIETVGNTAKKAGALNQGLARVLPLLSDDDFVLAMDADGELTGDFIPVALQIFRDVPDLGGLAGSVTARSADNVLELLRPSSTPAARVWPAAKAGRCTCCRERPPCSRRACCATSSGPAATNCPVGAYLLSTDGVRAGLTGWGFFLAAIALPMAQIRLGEETSFQKHLAFTALLLSYPAGGGAAPLVPAALALRSRGGSPGAAVRDRCRSQ